MIMSMDNAFGVSILADTGGEFKKWGNMPLKQAVFLFQWENRPPFVLEKDRTSLRKLNSPPVSLRGKHLSRGGEGGVH